MGGPSGSSAAGALLWGVAGACACLAVAGVEPNLVEEGLVVHFAQRLAAGEHLYRDLVFFTGPLPFELLALLFRTFGEEIAVGRTAAALFHGAAAAALYDLARRAGLGALAHVAGALAAAAPILLFPLFSMFYYTPLAFSLGAMAAWAGLRGTRSARYAFAAGVLAGAVALCKQTLGVALAAGLLASLAAASAPALRAAQLRALVAGAAAAAVVTVVAYGARGDLADLWRCLVTVPLGLGEGYTSTFINLWPPGRLAEEIVPHKAIYLPNLYFLRYGVFSPLGTGIVLATQVLYALPCAALLATLATRLGGPLPPATWCNGAFLFAMTANLFPRPDWGHLVFALPPALVQLLLLARGMLGSARARAVRVTAATLLVGAVTAACVAVASFVHGESGAPTWGPRVPLRPVSAVYRIPTVPRVIHYLRQRVAPGEAIFVARSEPLLYFATDTRNPTPYGGVLTVLNEEQEERILAALPGVRYVVMSDVDQPMWTYYAEELPRVQRHLERHFHVASHFPLDDASWLVVLERGQDRGETALDLIALRPEASAWLRDATGALREDAQPPPRLVARQNRRPLPMRLGRRGGGIDYEIAVPHGARFEADVGFRGMVSQDDLHEHPKRSRMRVSVGRGGVFETIAEVRVSDAPRAGRRWTPVAVDLSRWGGETVTLRLELVADAPTGAADLSWWGSPRIVADAVPSDRR
jgi:hypothetical protein